MAASIGFRSTPADTATRGQPSRFSICLAAVGLPTCRDPGHTVEAGPAALARRWQFVLMAQEGRDESGDGGQGGPATGHGRALRSSGHTDPIQHE